MLHRCSSGSQQSIAAAPTMPSTTFSLFFPLPKGQWLAAEDEAACDDDHSSVTTSPSSSSTGSVDCTLSLGTPSSRRAAELAELTKRVVAQPAYPSVSAATVSWDVAADQSSYYCQGSKPAGGAAKGAMAYAGHDPLLLDRCCANCGTTSTPLWRNGPRGPKSLCNACGIRYKKEERRAAAMESGAAGCGYSAQGAQHGPSAAKASHGAASYGEGAFPCVGDADTDAPLLAWRLNVVAPAPAPSFAVWPERTSLFQYN
ncbi:GATA transcription factor 15-like [Phragmites australis]|uniref:GATA transcription factor 15-like n=1 Tax=Phragmites australis TaxID=29695 RepID=UPI002D7A2D7D|nr:GATA transcription factor 15-like [Phragmites australis]